jgi:hypothetical protein
MANVTVNLVRVKAKPPLRALADVLLSFGEDHVVLHRCAVFERHGQQAWATFPRLTLEKDGKKLGVELVRPSCDLRRQIIRAILDEYGKNRNVL